MQTVDVKRLSLKSGSRILDAGCGSGRHICEAFRSHGVDVIGIDLKRDDIVTTRNFLSLMADESSGFSMVAMATITKLPFQEGVFDAVICSEVLEHIDNHKTAVAELLRVLKPGGNLAVSVPRFWPERICWAISKPYREAPGGHIRIYKKKELQRLLEDAGGKCWKVSHKHALHAPYWWLKCLVGHKNEDFLLVNLYKKFLEWEIIRRPPLIGILDTLLSPIVSKSVVFYVKKGR
jgi:ubiquinone/menaquinone biosynthesis C-methylase UbiE